MEQVAFTCSPHKLRLAKSFLTALVLEAGLLGMLSHYSLLIPQPPMPSAPHLVYLYLPSEQDLEPKAAPPAAPTLTRNASAPAKADHVTASTTPRQHLLVKSQKTALPASASASTTSASKPAAAKEPFQPAQPAPATTAPSSAVAAAPAQPAPDNQNALMADFQTQVQAAVRQAAQYPQAAKIMGLEGAVQISFQYEQAQAQEVKVLQSSHVPILDEAALEAARHAHYPAPPAGLNAHGHTFIVWIRFHQGQTG
jgi:protein TonB